MLNKEFDLIEYTVIRSNVDYKKEYTLIDNSGLVKSAGEWVFVSKLH